MYTPRTRPVSHSLPKPGLAALTPEELAAAQAAEAAAPSEPKGTPEKPKK
jgi:hypothetical protein